MATNSDSSSSSEAQSGKVYLVGAGPGDPALLTLRAAELLKTCDVILPDDLVSEAILDLASPTAIIIPVGKRCGQPRISQAGIHALMLEHTRPRHDQQACSVLRLKSGDPLIFGRAGEEIAFLREHHIPFEIVPGITAAFAVAASLETPLTDRTTASRLILATAHHAAGKPVITLPLPPCWEQDATLVLYMPGRDFVSLAASLIDTGIPSTTPCVAVSKASTTDERVTRSTLEHLGAAEVGPAPVLLLIGEAIRLV